jgi:hypothetical protein
MLHGVQNVNAEWYDYDVRYERRCERSKVVVEGVKAKLWTLNHQLVLRRWPVRSIMLVLDYV